MYPLESWKRELERLLDIDNSSDYNLDEEISRHSKSHVKWAFLLGKVLREKKEAELRLKVISAKLTRAIRKDYIERGEPLPKSYNVEKELLPLESEWIKAVENVNKYEEYVAVLNSIERAWHNRAYLLGSLSRSRDREPIVYSRREKINNKVDTIEKKMIQEYEVF